MNSILGLHEGLLKDLSNRLGIEEVSCGVLHEAGGDVIKFQMSFHDQGIMLNAMFNYETLLQMTSEDIVQYVEVHYNSRFYNNEDVLQIH